MPFWNAPNSQKVADMSHRLLPRPAALCLAACAVALTLAGCMNEGNVADKHPITFEKPKPAGGPTQAQAEAALRNWLVASVPDGTSAKDVSVGPVRYAAILIPYPYDYFACARFTAKNRYGTYMPPRNVLYTMRVYDQAEGWRLSLLKNPGDGAYDQYCISQPHG